VSHAFGLPPRSDRLQRLKRKCPECGGWDMGNVGVVMHKRDCPRNPDREYFDHLDQEHEDTEKAKHG